jgi:hypothetical protein
MVRHACFSFSNCPVFVSFFQSSKLKNYLVMAGLEPWTPDPQPSVLTTTPLGIDYFLNWFDLFKQLFSADNFICNSLPVNTIKIIYHDITIFKIKIDFFSSLLSLFAELAGYAGAFIEFTFPGFLLAMLLLIYKNRKILTRKRRGKFYLPTVAQEKKQKSESTAESVKGNETESVV